MVHDQVGKLHGQSHDKYGKWGITWQTPWKLCQKYHDQAKREIRQTEKPHPMAKLQKSHEMLHDQVKRLPGQVLCDQHTTITWLHTTITWPHTTITWPHTTITWPHTTITWPHTTITWSTHNYHMTTHNYHMTTHNYHMTAHNYHMTTHNHHMTTQTLVPVYWWRQGPSSPRCSPPAAWWHPLAVAMVTKEQYRDHIQ